MQEKCLCSKCGKDLESVENIKEEVAELLGNMGKGALDESTSMFGDMGRPIFGMIFYDGGYTLTKTTTWDGPDDLIKDIIEEAASTACEKSDYSPDDKSST